MEKKKQDEDTFNSFFTIPETKRDRIKVLNTQNISNISRKELKNGFILEKFFSNEECDHYIKQVEEIGFNSLKIEYPTEYRNSKRSCILSEELSLVIWERLLKFLKFYDIKNVKPMNYDGDGVWKPTSVNDGFKFSKYEKGEYFKPHIDNVHVISPNEMTIHTILIYLNDDYQGGKTNFIKVPEEGFTKFLEKDFKGEVEESVKPKKGNAVIFKNYVCHEGKEVEKGVKYVLKTELIFERVNKDQYLEKEKNIFYQKMMENYSKAVNGLLYEEDPLIITKNYLKGVDLQYKYLNSFNKTDLTYPTEIILIICKFLPIKTILLLTRLDKHWNHSILQSNIWEKRTRKQFSEVHKNQLKDYHGNKEVVDWYSVFKRTFILNKKKPFILEINDTKMKFITGIDAKVQDPKVHSFSTLLQHTREVIGCHNTQVNSYHFEDLKKDFTYGHGGDTKDIGLMFDKGRYKNLGEYSKTVLSSLSLKNVVLKYPIVLNPPLNHWDQKEFTFFEKLKELMKVNKVVYVPLTLGVLYFNGLVTGTVIYIDSYIQSISLYLDGSLVKESNLKDNFDFKKFMNGVDQKILKSKIVLHSQNASVKTQEYMLTKEFNEKLIPSKDPNAAILGIYKWFGTTTYTEDFQVYKP